MRSRTVVDWTRRTFGAWILVVSAITALRFLGVPSAHGAPGWLLVAIAGIETFAAGAFIWRPTGLALAGLLATYSAAAVIHVRVGEPPFALLAYALLTIGLYLGAGAPLSGRRE